ncbi:hypothetical protein ACSTEF_20800 [Vibrio vulnificus]|uniref:hypothetical protein n=1 Tax=Vibrio vulnificus TaxID=672 RepID=UPI003EDA4693
MSSAKTITNLLVQPKRSPRYLGFTPTQWRVAFRAWLQLLPSLTAAWLFALLSVSDALNQQPDWLFTLWAQALVYLAMAALTLLLCLRSYLLRTLPKFALLCVVYLLGGALMLSLPPLGQVALVAVFFTSLLLYALLPWSSWLPQVKALREVHQHAIELRHRLQQQQKQLLLVMPQQVPALASALAADLLLLVDTLGPQYIDKNRTFAGYVHDSVNFSASLWLVLAQDAAEGDDIHRLCQQFITFSDEQRAEYSDATYYSDYLCRQHAYLPVEKHDEAQHLLAIQTGLLLCQRQADAPVSLVVDFTLYQLPLLWRELNIFPEREGLPQSLLHCQQRVFYLLQHDACQLDMAQQNRWLAWLQHLPQCKTLFPSLLSSFCEYDALYPAHRDAFSPTGFAYVSEREQRFLAACNAIAARVKSPEFVVWHAKQAQQLLKQLEIPLVLAFHQFLLYTPASQLLSWLSLLPQQGREHFYQLHQQRLDIDVRAHFESQLHSHHCDACDMARVLRWWQFAQRVAFFHGVADAMWAKGNYLQDSQRYEYDTEMRLNNALLLPLSQLPSAVLAVLQELMIDVHSQQLPLQPFLAHLQTKFGPLLRVLPCEHLPSPIAWLLAQSSAQAKQHNQSEENHESDTAPNWASRLLTTLCRYYQPQQAGQQALAFEALLELFSLHQARYPVAQQTSEELLVQILLSLPQQGFTPEQNQQVLKQVCELPKDLADKLPIELCLRWRELARVTLQQHQLLEKLPLEKNYQEHWRRQQTTIHFDDATQ